MTIQWDHFHADLLLPDGTFKSKYLTPKHFYLWNKNMLIRQGCFYAVVELTPPPHICYLLCSNRGNLTDAYSFRSKHHPSEELHRWVLTGTYSSNRSSTTSLRKEGSNCYLLLQQEQHYLPEELGR
jgi:hypothetical protein